jgi:hypothetical protein
MRSKSSLLPLLTAVACAAVPALAQSGIALPGLGPVYDESAGAIRRIVGVPGAAAMSAPVDLGFLPGPAAVSAQPNLVMSASPDDGLVRVILLGSGAPRVRVVQGAVQAPDRLALSPQGAAAILYSASAAKVQVASGLTGVPAVVRDIPVAFAVNDLAVSDDGGFALALTGPADSQAAWLLGPEGNWTPLAMPVPVAAMSFRPSSAESIVAAANGDLYRVAPDGTLTMAAQLPNTFNTLFVRLSADGRWAYAAGANGLLARADLTAGVLQTADCSCRPTALEPLDRAGLYRLTNASSTLPVFLFDGAAESPGVRFVPAPMSAEESLQ